MELKKERDKNKNHPSVLMAGRTFGQKASDRLTSFAGSWAFIFMLFIFLVLWVLINAYFLAVYHLRKPFDPYPFILLNLILSCLAAVQAPIILLSQNRQAQRDRLRADYDYRINKKAEKEIEQVQEDLNQIKRILTAKRG